MSDVPARGPASVAEARVLDALASVQQGRIIELKNGLIERMADEELLRRHKQGLKRSAETYGSSDPLGVRLRGARDNQHFVVSAAGAGRDAKGVFIPANPAKPTRIDLYENDRMIRRLLKPS